MRDFSLVPVTLRVAGRWHTVAELMESLPEGFVSGPVVEDGTPGLAFGVDVGGGRHEGVLFCRENDGEFAEVVRTVARVPLEEREDELLESYSMQVCVTGHGGSKPRAAAMMSAAATVAGHGGCCVFCDNSGTAGGADMWTSLAGRVREAWGDDGDPNEVADALTFGFVGIVGREDAARTTGMQVLGLPDLMLRFDGIEDAGDRLIDSMRYVAATDRTFGDGHEILMPEFGLRLVATYAPVDGRDGASMANPWGRLELVRG